MIRGLFALCCTGLLLLAGCDKTPEPQKTSETQLIPAANAEIATRNPEMNVERMKFSWKALKDGAFVYGSDPSGALTGKFDPQRLQRIISLNGYVNAVPGFAESPQVINGASDLLVDLFGSRGLHARAAIGVSALPKNALVEIQMVAATQP
jgi:Endoribonuclease L-PSP